VFRYLREALDVVAALAPTLRDAVTVAIRKAFVILDGTLLRTDRVGMGSGRDRPYYSGKHQAHGMNVQVLADSAGRSRGGKCDRVVAPGRRVEPLSRQMCAAVRPP
jgi:hypothetical protein